jgi:hypothetical protein
MSFKLKEIFDRCPWEAKFHGQLPENPDEILYQWEEEEADVARTFMDSGIFHEETPVVRRSLYLGKNADGDWRLCIREVQHEDFDAKKAGQGTAALMDPAKLQDAFQRILGKK